MIRNAFINSSIPDCVDIILDASPYKERKSWEQNSRSAVGQYAEIPLGSDVSRYAEGHSGSRHSKLVLHLQFKHAKHAEQFAEDISKIWLVKIERSAVGAAPLPLPQTYNQSRAKLRRACMRTGKMPASNKDETFIKQLHEQFMSIYSFCEFGARKDAPVKDVFKFPCVQCGKQICMERPCPENPYGAPVLCGTHEQHLYCQMTDAYAQNTPCIDACKEINDVEYLSRETLRQRAAAAQSVEAKASTGSAKARVDDVQPNIGEAAIQDLVEDVSGRDAWEGFVRKCIKGDDLLALADLQPDDATDQKVCAALRYIDTENHDPEFWSDKGSKRARVSHLDSLLRREAQRRWRLQTDGK